MNGSGVEVVDGATADACGVVRVAAAKAECPTVLFGHDLAGRALSTDRATSGIGVEVQAWRHLDNQQARAQVVMLVHHDWERRFGVVEDLAAHKCCVHCRSRQSGKTLGFVRKTENDHAAIVRVGKADHRIHEHLD